MYYQPDEIWKIFGINSEDDYVAKFVVTGNFHSSVPEDVIKSYVTAEHLMALAYLDYPVYDQALQKVLGIYEMSIRLKCASVGIETTFRTNQRKIRSRNLADLIKNLLGNFVPAELEASMDWVKEIRNFHAHPSQYTLMGNLCNRVIVPAVNLINQIFLPITWYSDMKNEEARITDLIDFKNDVFVLNHNNLSILVHQPEIQKTINVDGIWVFALSFQPVLQNTSKSLSKLSFPEPIIRFLKDERISQNGITAIDAQTGEIIQINKTIEKAHIAKYNQHTEEYSLSENFKRFSYESSCQSHYEVQINQFIHQYCWK